MLNHLKKYNIILASNSPRRQELLSGLGIDFEIRVIKGIDESYSESLKPEEIPVCLARKKAEAYLPTLREKDILITADTIVDLDGEVLGKPKNREDAIRMLKKLSGKTHRVITGVCLTGQTFQKTFSTLSGVSFAELEEEDIIHYVDTFKPFDKAGSYGIQEWIGYIGVESIQGSFYNVMGLPIQRVYRELKRIK